MKNSRKLGLGLAALLFVLGLSAQQVEAGWRWRRARTVTTANQYSSFKHSSGVSRAEYDRWQRYDRWYDKAYNGFSPFDFR